MAASTRPLPSIFWDRVGFGRLDECWLWKGALNEAGYGEFVYIRDGKKNRPTAHRAAYRYTFGPIPDGLQINHRCDVRHCCNPRHLYAGTHLDNMRDMSERGRAGRPRGLTDEQVRDIRSMKRTGAALAKDLGVSQATISLIRTRRTYTDVE